MKVVKIKDYVINCQQIRDATVVCYHISKYQIEHRLRITMICKSDFSSNISINFNTQEEAEKALEVIYTKMAEKD